MNDLLIYGNNLSELNSVKKDLVFSGIFRVLKPQDPREEFPYRKQIGKLLYLTPSRRDISFSVCRLSPYLSAPTYLNMQVALELLSTVKPGKGLFFPSSLTTSSKGFCDSYWECNSPIFS